MKIGTKNMSNKQMYRVAAELYVDVEAKNSDQAWEIVHDKITGKMMHHIITVMSKNPKADYYFQILEPEDITALIQDK